MTSEIPHEYAVPQVPQPKILVVDDEASIRETLRLFLQDQGYRVEVAKDADQARLLLASDAWDVVVTDIILPGTSGVDLLKAVRAVAPHVQVIMMTGEPTVETAAEAVRAGARDYLPKPIVKNAILRSVATAVQIKRIDDERRHLQDENRRYQENLESLVSERTQALQDANRRLEIAMDRIQRSQAEIIKQERLSALGQMVVGIAHDLNNALMPIVGLSSYFLSDPDVLNHPDQLRADVEAIQRSAAAAADVVRRLREFYRPDEVLGTTSVNMSKLIEQVILLTEPAWKVQAEAENRDIRIVNTVDSVPPIAANEPRLREALINLVLNAVDAMPKGGVLRLGAESGAQTVTLRISDTGTGMSEDVRQRCFEPFFTTKGKRGSGLGLAMVYGIVTRHEGQITVESEEGRGTTFVIRLPLSHPQASAPAQKTMPLSNSALSPLSVLVVDDEDWARVLIKRFLTIKGHTVLTVASGQEALDAFRREPTDIVITDRALPDLNGDRIAVEIKRISPTTPVIMLTGFGDIMDIRRERPEGVDYVLGKPITPNQLQEAVAHAMGSRSQGEGQVGNEPARGNNNRPFDPRGHT